MPPKNKTKTRQMVSKVKVPQKNRNEHIISEVQTIYESSEEQQNWGFDPKSWDDQKLSIQYKPQKLMGREKEKKKVTDFINGCLMKQITNRCLYISGCPGIGKTATVMEIVAGIQKDIDHQKVKFYYINSLALKKPTGIYKQFMLKSNPKLVIKKEPNLIALAFDKFLKSTKTNFFFIIDEVDYLYTKNENVLYNIMEWCSMGIYKFSIILIANTMDFPEKLAPKITSRMGSWRMCFKPYSSEEIKGIVEERLAGSSFFGQYQINFVIKKFANYTSDLRKVFTVLKDIIQHRKGEKVTMQDIAKVWSRIAAQQDLLWQEQLPEIFSIVLDLIKKQGGQAHAYTLFDVLKQTNFSYRQVQFLLADLSQMGLVKLSQKKYKGVYGFSATLVSV